MIFGAWFNVIFSLLLFFASILFFAFAFVRPWRAVCVVLAILPAYVIRFSFFGIPTTLLEWMLYVLFSAYALHLAIIPKAREHFLQRIKKIPVAVAVGVMLIFIAAIVSVFVAPEIRPALGVFKAYFFDAMLFGLISFVVIRRVEDMQNAALALSLGAAFVSAYALVQKFTGWGIPNMFWAAEETRRVTSFFGYPNAVALYLELTIPLMIVAALECFRGYKRRGALWYAGVASVSVLAIIFARSSGGIAALVGTAIIFLIAFRRTRWFAITIVFACVVALAFSPYKKLFADEFLLQGYSGSLRTQMWGETIEMLRERPVLGAGLTGYQARVRPYHVFKWAEIYLYPHNLLLTLWSEIGLIGFIAFGWIFARAVFALLKSKRQPWPLGFLAVFLIIFIHGFVDVPYFKNDLSVFYWFAVAVSAFFSL